MSLVSNLDDFARLLELLDKHRVERFRSGSLCVSKSTWPSPHQYDQPPTYRSADSEDQLDEDDLATLLYHSE